MAKPITGKTHVGERREKRPNGDIYVYERITAYNEKTKKDLYGQSEAQGKNQVGNTRNCADSSEKTQRRRRRYRCNTSAYRSYGHSGMGWQGFRH